MPDDTRDKTGPLSQRQREVLDLLAQGLTRAQIDARMKLRRGIATNMISKSILPKLQLTRTAQAIALWGKAEGLREAADRIEREELILGPLGEAELHVNDCMMRLVQSLRERAAGLLP